MSGGLHTVQWRFQFWFSLPHWLCDLCTRYLISNACILLSMSAVIVHVPHAYKNIWTFTHQSDLSSTMTPIEFHLGNKRDEEEDGEEEEEEDCAFQYRYHYFPQTNKQKPTHPESHFSRRPARPDLSEHSQSPLLELGHIQTPVLQLQVQRTPVCRLLRHGSGPKNNCIRVFRSACTVVDPTSNDVVTSLENPGLFLGLPYAPRNQRGCQPKFTDGLD